MKSIYPSKGFSNAARVALASHEIFEVAILGGWRGRTLAMEIKSWPATATDARAADGKSKSPSIVTSIFMIRLFTIHWMALSAHYEMHSIVNGSEVLIGIDNLRSSVTGAAAIRAIQRVSAKDVTDPFREHVKQSFLDGRSEISFICPGRAMNGFVAACGNSALQRTARL